MVGRALSLAAFEGREDVLVVGAVVGIGVLVEVRLEGIDAAVFALSAMIAVRAMATVVGGGGGVGGCALGFGLGPARQVGSRDSERGVGGCDLGFRLGFDGNLDLFGVNDRRFLALGREEGHVRMRVGGETGDEGREKDREGGRIER